MRNHHLGPKGAKACARALLVLRLLHEKFVSINLSLHSTVDLCNHDNNLVDSSAVFFLTFNKTNKFNKTNHTNQMLQWDIG